MLLNNNAQPTTIPNGTNFEHILTGVEETTYLAAKAADDYTEFCFTSNSTAIITQIQQGIVPTAWGGANAGNYSVAVEISSDGFATSSLLFQNAFIGDANAAGDYVLYQESLNYALMAGTNYQLRFYLYDENNNASLQNGIMLPDNTVAFDDPIISINQTTVTPASCLLYTSPSPRDRG